MKSITKTAFAILAVAMMIMVAVVPMVGVFTEKADADVTPVPSIPTSDTTTGGLTILIKDNSNNAVPYAQVDVSGTDYYADKDGKLQLKWSTVAGKTVKPEVTGFKFVDDSGERSIDVDTGVTDDSRAQSITFKAKEKLIIVNAKAKSGEAIQEGTISYGYGSEMSTSSGTATIYKVGDKYVAYVPQAKTSATGDDAKFYVSLTTGTIGTFSAFTAEKQEVTGGASTKELTAAQSIVTVTLQDAASKAITTSPTDITFQNAAGTAIPVIGSNVYTAGKIQAAFEIPAAVAAAEGVEAMAAGYKVASVTLSNYTFDAQTNVTTNVSTTLKANEQTYTLTFQDASKKVYLNGSTTVSWTTAISGATSSATADLVKGVATFGVPKDATAISIAAALDDDIDTALTFTTLTGKALSDLNKTYYADENVYKLSGKVYFADGSTLVKSTSAGLTVKFSDKPDAAFDATTGTYTIYVKEGVNGKIQVASSAGLTFLIDAEEFTVDGDYTRDFIAQQAEKVPVKITLNNTLSSNIGGSTYAIKLTPSSGSAVTLTYKDGVYTGDLVRGLTYTATVGSSVISTGESLGAVTWSEKSRDATIVLADVSVSGYIYAKWVSGDSNVRPLGGLTGENVAISGKGLTITNVTTNENGLLSTFTIPHGVAYSIKATKENTIGYYWAVDMDAIGDVGATYTIGAELKEVKYDVTGKVYAKTFAGSGNTAIDISNVTATVKVDGTEVTTLTITTNKNTFSFDLGKNKVSKDSKIDVTVTAVTATGYTFASGEIASWTGLEFKEGMVLEDKIFAKERAYSGTVQSANGYALNGTLTLTPSPSGDAKTLTVTDGKYVFPVDVSTTTQQLYKVSFTDSATSSNTFTIWDGKYTSGLFRASFTPGADQTKDTVVSGTLSTTISSTYINSVNNANFTTVEYVIAGKAISSTATTETAIGNLELNMTFGTTGVAAKEVTTAETTGKFYLVLNATDSAKLTTNTVITIAADGTSIFTVVDPKTVKMADADALTLKIKNDKTYNLTIKDAFGNVVKDEVDVDLYKIDEAVIYGSTVFKDGKATFTVSFTDATSDLELAAIADDLVYTLVAEEGEIYDKLTFSPSADVSTTIDVVTNEGTIKGAVTYVNDASVKIDGTIFITTDDDEDTTVALDVVKGAYTGIIKKSTSEEAAYSAYLVGCDYAFLAIGEEASSTKNTKMAIDTSGNVSGLTKVDSRIVSGVLKDGQGNVLANMGLEFTYDGEEFTATTDADGAYSFKLADGMYISTYTDAFTPVCIFNGEEDVYTFAGGTTVTATYSPFSTAEYSSFEMDDLATQENRVVVTFIGDKVSGIEVTVRGYGEISLATLDIDGYFEKFVKTTDANGQIVIDAAKQDTTEYLITTADGIALVVYEDEEVDTTLITVSGIAYINADNSIVAKNANVNFVYYNPDLLWIKAVTDENGKFSISLPATYVGEDFIITSDCYVDASSTITKITGYNVASHYEFDDVDFEAYKIDGSVKVKTIANTSGEAMKGQTVTMTIKDVYGIGDMASQYPGIITDTCTVTVVTDESGKYVVYMPKSTTVWSADYVDITLGGVDYTFTPTFTAVTDSTSGESVTIGYTVAIVTNEYRIFVPVAYKGNPVDGAIVQKSLDGVLYKGAYETVDGVATVDCVSTSTYLRAVAAGYSFTAGGLSEGKFNSTLVTFDGALDLESYTVCIGSSVYTAKEGDAFFVQYTTDGIFVKNGSAVVSEFDTGVAWENTKFLYWKLADGTTTTDESITFVVGGDTIKAVGNAYTFVPVFDASTSVDEIDGGSSNDKSIDPTVLVLGIAAVIVALIAVVYAVIQKKE